MPAGSPSQAIHEETSNGSKRSGLWRSAVGTALCEVSASTLSNTAAFTYTLRKLLVHWRLASTQQVLCQKVRLNLVSKTDTPNPSFDD